MILGLPPLLLVNCCCVPPVATADRSLSTGVSFRICPARYVATVFTAPEHTKCCATLAQSYAQGCGQVRKHVSSVQIASAKMH